MVKLNFPPQAELNVLIEYVSERLGVKILYDEEVTNKQITIKAPNEVPVESLMGVLESALKMKGLTLADAEVPGWKRIVSSNELAQVSETDAGPIEQQGPASAVTQTFQLHNIAVQQLTELIQPFLTQPGANVITMPEQNLLIVTDYGNNLRRIAMLVETVDKAGPETMLEFYTVKEVEASSLGAQMSEVMATRAKGRPAVPGTARSLQITHDDRTNQLLIVGTREDVDEVLELARVLDVPLGLSPQVYTFRYIAAERIDGLVKELLNPATVKRLYRSAIDADDNLLIATTTKEIHDRINWLQKAMDLETKRAASGVKFFRLKNSSAADVLQTLYAIERQSGQPEAAGPHRGVSALGRGRAGYEGSTTGRPSRGRFVPGPNSPATPSDNEPPRTPAFRNSSQNTNSPSNPSEDVGNPQRAGNSSGEAVGDLSRTGANAPLPNFGIVPGSARVSADPSSNTIIVVGDRAAQQVYAELIEFLDRRRPQVMVEAKVVIIDTSDDYSVGVELSTGNRSGVKRLLEFTSFGLSGVDPVTGALALIPGRGFNFTLVDPDEADVVLRALATHRRAKVISAPRILVNDNATGTLASVNEVPFTSVNASQTVATTSFAGFAEAGTTIEVTPRISDDDHLQLDYVVSLNSFTGTGGDGVPPPRQTDEVTSSVTIPDGHTIIVGGLTRKNMAHAVDGIPYIEKIPVLRELTQTTIRNSSQTTLFVFLRPVILRNDKFEFLKFMSDRDVNGAGICTDYPKSAPLLVR